MILENGRTAAWRAMVGTVMLGGVLVVAGCVASPAPTSASPTASPSPTIDTTTWIGEVIDPVGTTWTGRDSGGDETTVTLAKDHTVDISYGTNSYDDPNDTWSVTAGVLSMNVFIDDANGEAVYTGTWNPATSVIDGSLVTSVSARTLTVTLTQQ